MDGMKTTKWMTTNEQIAVKINTFGGDTFAWKEEGKEEVII